MKKEAVEHKVLCIYKIESVCVGLFSHFSSSDRDNVDFGLTEIY